MPAALPPCSVLILAGGRGQRMGGRDKGLLPWRGEPLVAHIQRVVRPLTDDLVISCNRNQQVYAGFADCCVGDEDRDYPGPLAGVIAGLQVVRHEWVVVLACDSPLIDRELIDALRQLAAAEEATAMVSQSGYWQPMFSVLPRRLKPVLQQAWQNGERSLQKALSQQHLSALECAADDRRLSNFNNPALLDL
ncbi:molybdenum cofactor guanylyltransferase MobA [Pseudomonas sp. SC11]|uniref:molybdenum cofactor guanylyltransferase MobA n=1 Tax=Pseudomonas sp. SC11 TaxID=326927 RepID=UPI00399AB8AE